MHCFSLYEEGTFFPGILALCFNSVPQSKV